jgi:hypothetical protein
MMKNTAFVFLVVALVASMCQAFTPAIPAVSSTTCLNLFGKIDNAYLRGGKPSWEFENETMYVEDPKAAKKPAAEAAPKAKVAPKVVAKKGAAAAKPTKKIYSF